MTKEPQKAPMEAPAINFSEDFDPRVFAGLDSVPAPPVFPAMEEEDEEQAAFFAELEEPVKKPKKEKKVKEKKVKQKKGKQMQDMPVQEKKGKAGVVISIILVVVLLLAAGAAGFLYWYSTPLKDTELEASFITNGPLSKEETAAEGFTFELLSDPARVTDRLGLSDEVWCKVTTQDETVKYTRFYSLRYELTWEGWVLAKDGIVEHQPDRWTVEPLTGATEDEIREALVGREVEIAGYTYALTEEDVAQAEIVSNPDLKAGTDVVQVGLDVTGELISWNTEGSLGMVFDEAWTATTFECSDVEWEPNPGMEFEVTDEEIEAEFVDMQIAAVKEPVIEEDEDEDKAEDSDEPVEDDVTEPSVDEDAPEADLEADLEAEPEAEPEASADPAAPAQDVVTDQMVTIKAEEITNLVVKEPEFDLEKGTYTVECTFDLDKPAVTVEVKAKLIYKFEEEWVMDSMEYSSSIKEIKLDGEWTGTYQVDAGGMTLKPSVTLTVTTDENGAMNGVFAFGPSEGFPIVPGSYHVLGKVDPATLEVEFEAGEWIENPNTGIPQASLKGTLNLDTGVITDEDTFTLTLKVPEPVAEPAQADAPTDPEVPAA